MHAKKIPIAIFILALLIVSYFTFIFWADLTGFWLKQTANEIKYPNASNWKVAVSAGFDTPYSADITFNTIDSTITIMNYYRTYFKAHGWIKTDDFPGDPYNLAEVRYVNNSKDTLIQIYYNDGRLTQNQYTSQVPKITIHPYEP